MRLKNMEISSQLKGGIYDVSFRYNTNLGGYTTSMSDIPKLGDMSSDDKILKTRYNKIPNSKSVIYVQR